MHKNKLCTYFVATVLMLLPFSPTFASTSEKVESLTLVGEGYSNGSLIREYRTELEVEMINTFDIPSHLIHLIDNQKNQILEAKKVLSLYYTFTNDQNSLAQINNKTFYESGYELSISKSIKEKIDADSAEIDKFIQSQSKDKKTKNFYLGTSNEKSTGNTSNSPSAEDKKSIPTDSSAPDNKEDNDEESSVWKYVGVGLLLTFIFGLVFISLRRR